MARFIFIRDLFTTVGNTEDPNIKDIGYSLFFHDPDYGNSNSDQVVQLNVNDNAAQWEVAIRNAAVAKASEIAGVSFSNSDCYQCALRRG
jgi:hypothetical protein